MSRKFESFERINSIRETNGNFDSCNSSTTGSQPFTWAAWVEISALIRVSNLTIQNFRIFLLRIRGPWFGRIDSVAGGGQDYFTNRVAVSCSAAQANFQALSRPAEPPRPARRTAPTSQGHQKHQTLQIDGNFSCTLPDIWWNSFQYVCWFAFILVSEHASSLWIGFSMILLGRTGWLNWIKFGSKVRIQLATCVFALFGTMLYAIRQTISGLARFSELTDTVQFGGDAVFEQCLHRVILSLAGQWPYVYKWWHYITRLTILVHRTSRQLIRTYLCRYMTLQAGLESTQFKPLHLDSDSGSNNHLPSSHSNSSFDADLTACRTGFITCQITIYLQRHCLDSL